LLKHRLLAVGAACLLSSGTVASPTFAQTSPTTAPAASPIPSLAPNTQQNAVKLLDQFRPIGGAGNSPNGQAPNATPNSPELHLAPFNFGPGPGDPLIDGPNPRLISNVISGGTGAQGQTSTTTDPGASAWEYVFGQFVDHDLDLESNTPAGTPINIELPTNDPKFSGSPILMTRDDRDPNTNTIINTAAGYLDLSQLYGSTTERANLLRGADGTLNSDNGGQTLTVKDGAFQTGDPRVMENPELIAVTTLFMREHNYWVATLHKQNPTWTGDQLYNMARSITTAEYQNIIYTEFLPLLLGPIPGYSGYNPHTNPQVSQEFAEAAFRMGHSQVSGTQEGIDNNGNVVFTESLADAFFNTPDQDIQNGINPLLRHLGVDPSQATDVYAVDELRNLLFAPLPGTNIDKIDLIAIDIQRERDAGLATLNGTRKALGLAPYTSFGALTSDSVLQKDLQTTFGSIDNVDLFIGGLAENHASNSRLGPTFQKIIGDQFQNVRAGDRFYWQNQKFDPHTASMIASTSLATILRRDTDSTNIQDHVFVPTSSGAAVKPAARTAAGTAVDTHGRPFLFP
jgi:peroxidase